MTTNNDIELEDMHKWLKDSFEAFLRDDPTRTTTASATMAADYAVMRFQAWAAKQAVEEAQWFISRLIDVKKGFKGFEEIEKLAYERLAELRGDT